MKIVRYAGFFALTLAVGSLALYSSRAKAQPPAVKMPPGRMAHVLVISQTKGFEHDSIPDAMSNIWRMGHDTKLWEATLRTDTELITKKDIKERNVKNLNYFDALIFASTTGELDLTDDQKSDMMSFIKDDGKGFVASTPLPTQIISGRNMAKCWAAGSISIPGSLSKRPLSMSSRTSPPFATSRTSS